MNWKRSISLLVILLISAALLTNPAKKDYLLFSEEFFGESLPVHDPDVSVERINFFLFSTYTPVVYEEHGVTHLGIYGQFIQISDGQFDYPWWLEFFS
jgi:hypothetical protein